MILLVVCIIRSNFNRANRHPFLDGRPKLKIRTAENEELIVTQLKLNIMVRFFFNPHQSSPQQAFSTKIYNILSANKFLLPVLFVTFSLIACAPGHHKELSGNDLQKAKDSIMATIEKETKCFFARDYEGWKSTYVQQDYDFQAWSNKDGTFDASVGWQGIDNTVGKYIHENPEPQSSHPVVERKNIKYKFYGNDVAFLSWDQFNSTREGTQFYHSKETRLMEKVNAAWKIVSVTAFWDYVNMIPASKLPDIERMDKESRGTSTEKLQ